METEYGDPIADCRDESTYPNPEKMNGPELAWEYIRRNPEYQKDFETCKNPPSLRYKWNLCSKWFRKRSGILKLLDPKEDKPRGLISYLKYGPIIFDGPGQNAQITSPLVHKNELGAVFNLDQPIAPQIKSIKDALEREQDKRGIKVSSSRPHRRAHLIFWKILDAKAQKVSEEEIRKIFKFKKSDYDAEVEVNQLKDRLRDACNWRDSKYITLVNLRKPNPPKKQKKRKTKATKPIPKRTRQPQR